MDDVSKPVEFGYPHRRSQVFLGQEAFQPQFANQVGFVRADRKAITEFLRDGEPAAGGVN
jgi:hypothetical protein